MFSAQPESPSARQAAMANTHEFILTNAKTSLCQSCRQRGLANELKLLHAICGALNTELFTITPALVSDTNHHSSTVASTLDRHYCQNNALTYAYCSLLFRSKCGNGPDEALQATFINCQSLTHPAPRWNSELEMSTPEGFSIKLNRENEPEMTK